MSGSDHKPAVGVLGLGLMGSRMAKRLLEAGYPLAVYNRTREKAATLERAGAACVSSPRELAARSEVVLSSLANDAAVEAVYRGPGGVLEGARPGMVILEASTIDPATSRALHGAAAAKGVEMLDSPVSGSTPQAEQGQLAFLVGGKAELFQRCVPVFQTLGKSWFHIGGPGAGSMMKLVVNTLLGLGIQALAEAMALGRKGGIGIEHLVEVLGQLAVTSPSQKSKLENARSGQFAPNFPLRLMYKDFGLATRKAAELSVPMPATAAAQQVFAAANTAAGDQDLSAVIAFLQRIAGVDGAQGGPPAG